VRLERDERPVAAEYGGCAAHDLELEALDVDVRKAEQLVGEEAAGRKETVERVDRERRVGRGRGLRAAPIGEGHLAPALVSAGVVDRGALAEAADVHPQVRRATAVRSDRGLDVELERVEAVHRARPVKSRVHAYPAEEAQARCTVRTE
jgi:hypothetical protein